MVKYIYTQTKEEKLHQHHHQKQQSLQTAQNDLLRKTRPGIIKNSSKKEGATALPKDREKVEEKIRPLLMGRPMTITEVQIQKQMSGVYVHL